MGRIPLLIDAKLVRQARASGSLFKRTPTAQFEFWAMLGRVMEAVLTGENVVKLKEIAGVDDVDAVLALTRTKKGRERARAVIARHKGPVYGADPDQPDVVIETRPDRMSRRGKFINRRFTELPVAAARP
jgi:hypothetical protein